MPQYEAAGTYHDRQRCRRAHASGDRLTPIDDTDGLDPCPHCVEAGDDGDETETCTEVKSDGEVCGRDRPCPYHDKRE
jgi:hypothetical protein